MGNLGMEPGMMIIKERKEKKMIILTYKSATAKLTFEGTSFMWQDIDGLVSNPIVEILSLKSEEQNKNHGTGLLKIITDKYNNHLIILKAEPMFKTEEEWAACLDLDARLEKLKEFYIKRNFKSINDFVGYELGEAMCYNNNAYLKLRQKINTFK